MESNSITAVSRPWLWPNLLSLDAPLVAVAWQLLFARCFHAGVDAITTALLMLSVWLIYAADRILDAWTAESRLPRHEFYRRHWRVVAPVWSTAFAFAAWLAWTHLSTSMFVRGAAISGAVAIYFAVVHALRPAWPKELAVAIVFAAGASVAAWGAIQSPADIETIALFCGLCWINCVAIESWENERWEKKIARMPVGMIAMLLAGAATLIYPSRPVLSGAEIASALGFVLLDYERPRLSRDALRVLADVALLTPLLFLPISEIIG